jgi:hypothetical protein
MRVYQPQPPTSSGPLPAAPRELSADALFVIVGGGQVELQTTDPDEPPPGKPQVR